LKSNLDVLSHLLQWCKSLCLSGSQNPI
jgi:hypothetical protein